MTDLAGATIFVERSFSAASRADAHCLSARDALPCLDLYRVNWVETLRSADGRRLLCRFRAPDAESVRRAMRCTGTAVDALWPGTVIDADRDRHGNVAVERTFADSLPDDREAALDMLRAGLPWHLELVRAIVGLDRRHAIVLCEAAARTGLGDSAWRYEYIDAIHLDESNPSAPTRAYSRSST